KTNGTRTKAARRNPIAGIVCTSRPTKKSCRPSRAAAIRFPACLTYRPALRSGTFDLSLPHRPGTQVRVALPLQILADLLVQDPQVRTLHAEGPGFDHFGGSQLAQRIHDDRTGNAGPVRDAARHQEALVALQLVEDVLHGQDLRV